ncbi:glucosamine-6-phosphate deaminase, partial [Curtobacterium ammoniigenes]|uniref:glucosamine-6-phosphate deaminase n=1 Tax=Curtobacterium ammoniigenes TaxID=395387 RepID=UPI0009FB2B4D
MELIVVEGDAAIGAAGAHAIARILRGRKDPVFGVATGSSPIPVYQALRDEPGIPWDTVSAFALDEYVGLKPDHSQSYARFLEEHVVRPLGLRRDALHVPGSGVPDEPAALAAAASDYERAITGAGGIDVQIVGIGRNGHLAFNEPGSAFDSRTRVVDLTDDTRAANARFFSRPEDVPYRAMSQGIGTILQARAIVLIASGADKAEALDRAINAAPSPDCPASALQLHGNVTVVTDCDVRAGAGDGAGGGGGAGG